MPKHAILMLTTVLICAFGCRPALPEAPNSDSAQPSAANTLVPLTTEQPVEKTAAVETTTLETATAVEPAAETAVILIPLAGEINSPNAEISGMAWHGEWLILLPQYPAFSASWGDGFVYALPRADILAFLDGTISGPLEPVEIPITAPGLRAGIDGYEGFEAVAIDGDRAYLTIEASPASGMTGYLAAGEMAPDLPALTIDTEKIVEIPSASGLPNKSDEALLLFGGKVLTFHEANGIGVNDKPVAQRFDAALRAAGAIPFPAVEYRITDVTAVDEDGRFWAINYFYPGEPELDAAVDPIGERYGLGATHAGREGVERLLEFQISESGVALVEQAPVQLELLPDELRNWEGIVRLGDRGFLIATDKFPETMLGFVAYP